MIKVPLSQVVKGNRRNTEYSQQNQYQSKIARYTHMTFSAKPFDPAGLSNQSGYFREN